jgi:membrane protein DedA with SNARE-associated domain
MQNTKGFQFTRQTEMKWLAASLLLSLILISVATNFRFGAVRIAHDPWYHLHPVKATILLALFLYTLKNCLLILDLGMRKAPVLGFIFAMIVPVLTLFCIYLLYGRALIVGPDQNVEIAQNQIWLLGILIAVLTAMEIRIFLTVRKFLGSRYSSE